MQRHGLSTVITTQPITSIAKPYRKNISKLVTSYNPNRNDMKTIIDDYLNGVDKTETNYIIKQLKDNKHARLEINLRHPYGYNVVAPHLK